LIGYGLGILQGFIVDWTPSPIERSAKCDWVFVFFGWWFLRKKKMSL
jgi:hypothetical protein